MSQVNEIRFYKANDEFGFLSNLYPAPIIIEEKPWDFREFATSEHAFQFMKPKSLAVADWLGKAPFPDVCATSAHHLLGYRIREDWKEIEVPVMKKVLWEKCEQHKEIFDLLLQTKGCKIIENSKTDSFWGEGKNGKGLNKLGELWMDLRDNPTDWAFQIPLFKFEENQK